MEEISEVIDLDAAMEEQLQPVNPTEKPPTPKAPETINFKDALKLLDEFAAEKTFECWVPSLNKEASFKEVNAAQQKELLKSIVDSPFYRSKFITTTYEILKQNLVSSDIQLDQLDIIDKQLILLKTRIECFNAVYELTTETGSKSIQLNKLFDRAKKGLKKPKGDSITKDEISVKVGVPNILTEYQLEKELHSHVDLLDLNNTNTLRSTLGEIFISEISKYISEITLGDKVIDFSSLKFKARIEIVEHLPNTLIQKIVQYIDKIKESIDSITAIKTVDAETDKETTELIAMDGAFFSIK